MFKLDYVNIMIYREGILMLDLKDLKVKIIEPSQGCIDWEMLSTRSNDSIEITNALDLSIRLSLED